MQMSINLNCVELGENKYHLRFKGHIPRLDVNKEYTFDYIGTETTSNSSLTGKHLDILTEELYKDFNSAPFDLAKAKKILGRGKQYKINIR